MHFRGNNSVCKVSLSLLTSVSLSLYLSLFVFLFRKGKYYRIPFKGDDESSKTWRLDRGRRDKVPREMS